MVHVTLFRAGVSGPLSSSSEKLSVSVISLIVGIEGHAS